MNNKNIKIIISFLLILITFRIIYVYKNLNHDCSHEYDCPICMIIEKFSNEIGGYNPNLIEIIIVLLFLSDIPYSFKRIIFSKKETTLIGLKVELIN